MEGVIGAMRNEENKNTGRKAKQGLICSVREQFPIITQGGLSAGPWSTGLKPGRGWSRWPLDMSAEICVVS